MRTASLPDSIIRNPREPALLLIGNLGAAAGVLIAAALRPYVPAWAEMWLPAGSLFAFFKWLTWSRRSVRHSSVGTIRTLGYLFCWVGLDADEFCAPAPSDGKSAAGEWGLAVAKTVLGVAVLWGLIRCLPGTQPVVIGGLGFAGLIVFLHFGLFHLLALAWQRQGVGVQPIMHFPLLATSLGDFWGRRWNRAYRRVSFDWIFRPAFSRFGAGAGTLIAFTASGLIHEAVISYPARGGYGGPTAYFFIQGLGLLLERTPRWRRLTQRFPVVGWLATLLFVLGPVGLLFHGPFLTRVIVPFLKVIGACLT
jgi:alginate O-acetyltransferase complex protein AlgI